MKLRVLAVLHLLRNSGCIDRATLDECETLARAGELRIAFESLISAMEREGTVLTDKLTAILADLAAELGVSAAHEPEASHAPTSRDYRCRVNDELRTCVIVNDCSSPIEAVESVALDHWSCLSAEATVETLTIHACDGTRIFKCVVKPKLTCSAEVESCEECEVN